MSVWTLRLHGVLFFLGWVLTELIVLQHLTQYAWKYKIKAVSGIFFLKKKKSFHGLKAECVTCYSSAETNSREKLKVNLMMGFRALLSMSEKIPVGLWFVFFNLGAVKYDKETNHLPRKMSLLCYHLDSHRVCLCQSPWLRSVAPFTSGVSCHRDQRIVCNGVVF